MPIADRAATAVLSSLAEGVWTLLGSKATPVTGGFDVLEARWCADFRGRAVTELEVIASFPLGARFGSTDFWLRDASPQRVGGNVWIVACRYEGRISAAKPPHVAITGAAGADSFTISAPSGSGVGSTTYFKSWFPFPITLNPGASLSFSIRESVPALEYSYVQVGGVLRTRLVGLGSLSGSPRVAPPWVVPSRNFPWDDFTSNNWRLNIPSGWVFDDLRSDRIDGAAEEVHYVTEIWVVVPLYKPQG